MAKKNAAIPFELVTWYDTWNLRGLSNLQSKKVPLAYATRYNLAFGQLSPDPTHRGYTVEMTGQYADAVRSEIQRQAPGARIYAGLRDQGLNDAATDNALNQNRSTRNIVAWLKANGYHGISIDAEDRSTNMLSVPVLVTQLGPSFRTAGLGIAVSVPWPDAGPEKYYGARAVADFNAHVDALELQDYSSQSPSGTIADAPLWIQAKVKKGLLLGGVCTENSDVKTSLSNVESWTRYALQNKLGGMFSWRLDNDHSTGANPLDEDVNPTFAGAKTIYDTVQAGSRTAPRPTARSRAALQPSTR